MALNYGYLTITAPFTKKRANISFGKYPEVTLAEARNQRKEARELLAVDIDPKINKEEQAVLSKEAIENTFGVMAQKCMN